MPFAFVIELGVMLPPPFVTLHVTVTPLTGFSAASVTLTESRRGRVPFTESVCPLPPAAEMRLAEPVLLVSTNTAGEPVRPPTVAVTVSGPAADPRVQVVRLATPDALVAGVAPVIAPFREPPAPSANVTVTPDTGLANWSVIFTDGGLATAVLAVAVCELVPATIASVFALPWVAVAEKLVGEPASPAAVPDAVCTPAVVPRTRVAVATPFAPVIEEGVMLPPPATPHVTVTPATGFPARSFTESVYATGSVAPAVSVCPSPAPFTRVAACPAAVVTVKITGEPVRPVASAESVTVPGTVPSTRVALAMPEAFVVPLNGVSVPGPPIPHVTVAPATGFPSWSVTRTESVPAVAPIVSLCELGESQAMVFGVPATPVAVKVSTGRRATVAVREFEPVLFPSCQLPTVAMPDAFVVAPPPVTAPPPVATAKVTEKLGTGFPNWSFTSTEGLVGSALPAAAVCPSPPFFVAVFGTSGPAVTMNETEVNPGADAVSVSVRAVVASLKLPTVATPDPLVPTDPPVTVPFAAVAAKVTVTPATGLPN